MKFRLYATMSYMKLASHSRFVPALFFAATLLFGAGCDASPQSLPEVSESLQREVAPAAVVPAPVETPDRAPIFPSPEPQEAPKAVVQPQVIPVIEPASLPVEEPKKPVIVEPEPPAPVPVIVPSAPSTFCCKVCKAGKACGDSCISRDKTCHKGDGCACDG